MIDPQNQWAIQIEVTNACTRRCSNCTRFVGHRSPFFMSMDTFAVAVDVLKTFPYESLPFRHETHRVKNKVVGMMGGEPLLHPQFPQLVSEMVAAIPDRRYRGLWTGLQWERTKHADVIRDSFGYINNNLHKDTVLHSPILVASRDEIPDEEERRKVIDGCWLQRTWSGSINHRGFYFCEVAASLSLLLDGPPGLPVTPDCWRRPLSDFQEQIDWACQRCGVALNLKGRRDDEEVDDVSLSNLDDLQRVSRRIQEGCYVLRQPGGEKVNDPWRYIR